MIPVAPCIGGNPSRIDIAARLTPRATHWFGTGDVGRDVMSRIVHSARLSLLVGETRLVLNLNGPANRSS